MPAHGTRHILSRPPPAPWPSPALAGHYWLFHSVWHLFMAEAYHLLYHQLEGAHLEGQDSEASELASRLSSGSWASAAALLQPAQRLVRTRRGRGQAASPRTRSSGKAQ